MAAGLHVQRTMRRGETARKVSVPRWAEGACARGVDGGEDEEAVLPGGAGGLVRVDGRGWRGGGGGGDGEGGGRYGRHDWVQRLGRRCRRGRRLRRVASQDS